MFNKPNFSFILILVFILLLLPISSFAQETATSNSVTTKVGNPSGGAPSSYNFVFYCQGDPRWQSLPQYNLGAGGCGPTSVAMVLNSFGVNINPLEVDKEFQSNIPPLRGYGDGPSYLPNQVAFGAYLDKKGFTLAPICNGRCTPKAVLDGVADYTKPDNGYLIIGSSQTYNCPLNCSKPTPHIFVIDKADVAAKTLNIRDPIDCTYGGDGSELSPGGYKRSVDSIDWYYVYAIKKK